MATRVGTSETIILDDDTEVFIKSLPILRLRTFMEKLNSLSDVKSEEEYVDFVLALALFCLKNNKAVKDRDEEDLGEVVDLPTAYKIIEVCGGVKLNDPKLAEMAEALDRMNTDQTGTN